MNQASQPSPAKSAERESHVIEWYRLDASKKFKRVLIPAALLMSIGSVLVCLGMAARMKAAPVDAYPERHFADLRGVNPGVGPVVTADHRSAPRGPWHESSSPSTNAMFILGFILVVSGPLTAIIGLRTTVNSDDYVLVKTDGLHYNVRDRQEMVFWDEVDCVEFHDGQVKLLRSDDSIFALEERFAGTTPEKLAKRLEEVRRQVAFYG